MRKKPTRPIDRSIYHAGEGHSLDPTALDTPERALAYFRSQNLINGESVNIQEAIESNPELELSFEDIGDFDAYIEKIENSRYRIVINAKHSENRKRFSMMHEFAHYQLHRNDIENMPPGERILHRGEDVNSIEYQANQYAAEILMPESTFTQIARASGGDIAKISSIFEVSQLAVRYRAKSLGIGGHGL